MTGFLVSASVFTVLCSIGSMLLGGSGMWSIVLALLLAVLALIAEEHGHHKRMAKNGKQGIG